MPAKITLDNPGGEGSQITPEAVLKKERGVWVYQGEPTHASIPVLIDREREKRLRDLVSPSRWPRSAWNLKHFRTIRTP